MSWQLICKACGLPFWLNDAKKQARSQDSPLLITVECPVCHAIYDYTALELYQPEYPRSAAG